jgi:hypothetical protein
MSLLTRTSFAAATWLALAVAPASAAQFVLHFEGTTGVGGQLPNTSAIASGLAFSMDALFDDASKQFPDPGLVMYDTLAASVWLDGTTYTLDPTFLTPYKVQLADANSPLFSGLYFAAFGYSDSSGNLAATFAGVTSPLAAQAPSATTFTGYTGALENTPVLRTAPGQYLQLQVSVSMPVSASISAFPAPVPEPTSLALMLAGVAGLAATARRRAKAAA